MATRVLVVDDRAVVGRGLIEREVSGRHTKLGVRSRTRAARLAPEPRPLGGDWDPRAP
jgi:hypothetical protein